VGFIVIWNKPTSQK